MRKKNIAFTLIEILTAAAIILILVGISTPFFVQTMANAKKEEAYAGLHKAHTKMRLLFSKTGAYNKALDGATIHSTTTLWSTLGFRANELRGYFYRDTDYSFNGNPQWNSYSIRAKRSSDRTEFFIDQTGNITRRF